MTLSDFRTRLRGREKKCVGTVTIAELCSVRDYPNGIYFFFDDQNDLWYVGKATSRSFVGRIASHFDPREEGWLNTVPKKIMKTCGFEDYCDAHQRGLALRLVLLGINDGKVAARLESALRSFLKPKLNSKNGKVISDQKMLNQFDD